MTAPDHAIFENVNLDRLAEAELADIASLRGLKAQYEAAHPETRNGWSGGRGGRKRDSDALTFSKILAEADGISLRTAERYIRIADCISPDTEARIYAHARLIAAIARRRTELVALTHYDSATQDVILDEIVAGRSNSVGEAAEALGLVTRLPRWQREASSIKRTIKRMDRRALLATICWMHETGLIERALAQIAAGEAAGLPGEDADDLDLWKSASEIAALSLKGLPATKKGIQILAGRAGWSTRQSTGRGGTVTLYNLADLPLNARRAAQKKLNISESSLGLVRLDVAESARRGKQKWMPTETVYQNGENVEPDSPDAAGETGGADHG